MPLIVSGTPGTECLAAHFPSSARASHGLLVQLCDGVYRGTPQKGAVEKLILEGILSGIKQYNLINLANFLLKHFV